MSQLSCTMVASARGLFIVCCLGNVNILIVREIQMLGILKKRLKYFQYPALCQYSYLENLTQLFHVICMLFCTMWALSILLTVQHVCLNVCFNTKCQYEYVWLPICWPASPGLISMTQKLSVFYQFLLEVMLHQQFLSDQCKTGHIHNFKRFMFQTCTFISQNHNTEKSSPLSQPMI